MSRVPDGTLWPAGGARTHEGTARRGGHSVAARLIERVVIQSETEPGLLTTRGPLYRLTEQADPDEPADRSSCGVEPETGTVYYVMPDGEAWSGDSSVDVWLDVLHR